MPHAAAGPSPFPPTHSKAERTKDENKMVEIPPLCSAPHTAGAKRNDSCASNRLTEKDNED